MRTVRKNVYYCEHCRKHGLSRVSMERHERHCTLNPQRACRWVIDGAVHQSIPLKLLVDDLQQRAPLDAGDIRWLRLMVYGCPACMLSALRQSGLEYHYDVNAHTRLFDYAEEVERFRTEEREGRRTYE